MNYTVGVGGFLAYPLTIPVAGTWSDPDGNLVEMKVLLRKSTDTVDRLISDTTFSPSASQSFKTSVQIETAGAYVIKFIARDATNLVTEIDVAVQVTGSGAKCALPRFFDCNGLEIVDVSGSPQPGGPGWTITPGRFIPYGPITMTCSTPGAAISFNCNLSPASALPIFNGGALVFPQASTVFNSATNLPYFMPTDYTNEADVVIVNNSTEIDAYSTCVGFTNSDKVALLLLMVNGNGSG